MYDHIGLHVANLDDSVRFYTAALAGLGHELVSRDDSSAGFGSKDAQGLWLYAETKARGLRAHVAFTAPTRAAVDRFYTQGVAAGGKNNGKPGVRSDYGANYYAAFLLDPDGNNVEAVCLT